MMSETEYEVCGFSVLTRRSLHALAICFVIVVVWLVVKR